MKYQLTVITTYKDMTHEQLQSWVDSIFGDNPALQPKVRELLQSGALLGSELDPDTGAHTQTAIKLTQIPENS